MPNSGEIKTPKELGITDEQWVELAEELVYFRAFARQLPNSPLGILYLMRVDYLEKYFGINTKPRIPDTREINQEIIAVAECTQVE